MTTWRDAAGRQQTAVQQAGSPGRARCGGLRWLMLACLVLPCLGLPGLALAVPADHLRPELTPEQEAAWLQALTEASPHRQAMLQAPVVAASKPKAPALALFGLTATPAQPAKAGKQLLGYLPYWTKSTAQIPWARLTQLAWFSAEVDATGQLSDTTGWGGSQALAVRETAHQNGVQLLLTITNFNTADISAILATQASRKVAIDAIVAKVVAGQGDGVNIDFEGLAKADKARMVSFASELRTALQTAIPGSHLSFATPAVDWNGAWDYDALAETSDGLMIMAYAIHYGGGNPGPQLPMASDAPWSHKTLQWIVQDYLTWGGSQNAHKFYLGLPLYGYTWPSSSGLPGAAKTASGKAIFFDAAQTQAAALGGWQWDPASQSTYVAEQTAGGWQQTWCDSESSFAARVAYADQNALQVGLWALGYADASAGVGLALEQWQADQPITGTDAGTQPDADAGSSADAQAQDSTTTADASQSADTSPLNDAGPPPGSDDVWVWDPSQYDGLGAEVQASDAAVPGPDSALAESEPADAGSAVSTNRAAADGCTARPVGSPAAGLLAALCVFLLRRRRLA